MTLPVLIEQILVQMSGIPADFSGANEIIKTCRPLCDDAAKFPGDDMPCNTTLGKFIHKKTELDYLYSSLKEGTCIKFCGVFTVFIVDLSLTRHFNSLRSKLPRNTHLSSDIDEFSAS